jgi:dehydrogenase/reductase SDR family protein 12
MPIARAVDALLEASVIGSFSRIGLSARSRLLPEFTSGDRPGFTGRVAIVTGATSGLGLAAAIELARLGGSVHFLARDPARAEQAQRQIAAAAGGDHVTYGLGDLDDLDSVRAFAREFRATHDRLDVLIHCAGAIHHDYLTNEAGIELTVAGQVIAPFLLTRLLLPPLRAAAPARVIAVSSGGMYSQRLDPGTLQMPAAGYNGVTAYARAKRAQVALSREWARRLTGTGIAFHAMHPGWTDTPGLAAALPGFHRMMGPILRSPQQGADTIVWLATTDAGRLGSGQFWHDRRPRSEYLLPWTRESSPAIAAQLWERIAEPAQPAGLDAAACET